MKVHVVTTRRGKIKVVRMPQEAGVSPWAVVAAVDLARMSEWLAVDDADLEELRSEIATDFALHPFHQDQMAAQTP